MLKDNSVLVGVVEQKKEKERTHGYGQKCGDGRGRDVEEGIEGINVDGKN